MKIRTRTIEITPFITLTEESINQKCIVSEISKTMQDLKHLLSRIIGIQNNMIGLNKDLSVGWPINAVVVMQALRMSLSDRSRIRTSEGELERSGKNAR